MSERQMTAKVYALSITTTDEETLYLHSISAVTTVHQKGSMPVVNFTRNKQRAITDCYEMALKTRDIISENYNIQTNITEF